MVVGAAVISYHKVRGFHLSRGVVLSIVAALIFSIHNLFLKFLLGRMDFWTEFGYERIGTFFGLIPLFYIFFKPFLDLIKTGWGFGVTILNNFITLLGSFFFTVAASLGYITLTTSFSAVQPFFVLVIMTGFGFLYPHILKEEPGKGIFFQKLIAIVLMFVGVILII